MSIEKNIERIADALEHLCAHADRIVAMQQNALQKMLQDNVTDSPAMPLEQSDAPVPTAKKSRSKKATYPATAEPPAAATAEVLSAPAPQPEPAHGTAPMTLDECNSKLQQLVMGGKSGSAIMDLLGSYHESRNLRHIDPVHYAEIIERVEAL